MATVHVVAQRDGWARRSERPPESPLAGVGVWLRQAREARGLTIDDVARETKIPLRHLESLEHGRLDIVPAFYQRAEVRAVAKAIGVDEGLAVRRLESAVAPTTQPPEPAPSPPRPSDLGWMLTIAGATLALGALLWLASRVDQTSLETAQPSPGIQAVAPEVTLGSPEPVPAPPQASPAASVPTALAASAPVAPAVSAPVSPAASVPVGASVAAAAVVEKEPHAPTSSVTELVIRTEPPGAHVTVNGIGWGPSPVTIRHLPPGEKRIRVTREGFATLQRGLTLDEGQQRTIDLSLQRAE